MKAPYTLATDQQLMEIVQNHKTQLPIVVAMAMEILEYRLHYGRLGCVSLDAGLSLVTKNRHE